MFTLKNRYESLVVKFLAKRDIFQRFINSLREKGQWTRYQDLHEALQAADALKFDLSQGLLQQDGGNNAALSEKFKKFKMSYKKLARECRPLWQQWATDIVVALVLCFVLRNFVFSPYQVPSGSAEPTMLVGDRLWGNKAAYFFDTVKHGDLVIFDDPRQGYDTSNYFTYYWQKYVGIAIPLLGIGAGPINVVKRVIGIPGDVIEGRLENGKTVIYRNGEKLDEPYVNKLPLIALYKDKGLIKPEWVFGLPLPDFLRKEKVPVFYTYDPSVSYEQQPYYSMNESEVIKDPATGKPFMREALSPSYSYNKRCIDEFGPIRIPEGKYWVMGDSRKNSDDSRGWYFLDKEYIHGRASFILYSIDSEEAFWLFDFIKHPIDFWTKHVRWNRTFTVFKR